MKVTCEYCKNSFDLNKYSSCPSCGGRIQENCNQSIEEEIKKIKREKYRLMVEEDEIDKKSSEEKKKILNNLLKFTFLFPLFIVVLFILFLIINK